MFRLQEHWIQEIYNPHWNFKMLQSHVFYGPSWLPSEENRVCELHFLASDLEWKDKRWQPRENCFPTIFPHIDGENYKLYEPIYQQNIQFRIERLNIQNDHSYYIKDELAQQPLKGMHVISKRIIFFV